MVKTQVKLPQYKQRMLTFWHLFKVAVLCLTLALLTPVQDAFNLGKIYPCLFCQRLIPVKTLYVT